MTQNATRIADAVWEPRRARIQQKSGGFEPSGCNDNHLGARFFVNLALTADVVDACRPAFGIGYDVTHDRVAQECETPGFRGRGKRYRGAVEIGSRVATSLALIAVMACWAPIMRHG